MAFDPALVDLVSDFMHDQWSEWWANASSDLTLSKCVDRDKLASTPFVKLTEDQKDMDREWAVKLLELLQKEED